MAAKLMNLNVKHSGFTGEAEYQLECRVTRRIGLDDGAGHQQLITVAKVPHAVYKVGQWTVEASTAGRLCALRLKRKLPAEDQMEVNFEEGTIPSLKLKLRMEGAEERSFNDVSNVLIQPNKVVRVTVECSGEDGGGSGGGTGSGTGSGTGGGGASETEKQLAAAREKLAAAEKAKQDLEKKQAAAEKTKQNLEKKLAVAEEGRTEAERLLTLVQRDKAALEKVAGARIEELLEVLNAARDALDEAQRAQLEELNKLNEENRRLEEAGKAAESEKEKAEARKAELEREAAILRGAKESLELDCEAIARELETLRRQLGDDEDTAELMEEDPCLKDNSVPETLEQVRKELAAAEERLVLVIRKREKRNAAIQDTIRNGNGSIPLSDERGEETDGDGSGAEETDP